MRNSTILFVEARPRAEETAAAKEEVSSVVVLESTKSNQSVTQGHLYRNDREERGRAHSFAKTPLNAAQAPLAAASASQGVVMRIIEGFFSEDGGAGLENVPEGIPYWARGAPESSGCRSFAAGSM